MRCPHCGLHCKTMDERNTHIKKCSRSLIMCRTCKIWFIRREIPKQCLRHKKYRGLGTFLQSFPPVLTQLIVTYAITPKLCLDIMADPEQHIIHKPAQLTDLFGQDFDLAYITLVKYVKYTRRQVCDVIRQCERDEAKLICVDYSYVRSSDPMYYEIVDAFTDVQFNAFLTQMQHCYRYYLDCIQI